MSAIAIIPARGGSKRIPRKNIREFSGKPIITYAIQSALKSGLFDEVMVSTDDDEIAEMSRKLGANVPFLRTKKNADDHATTFDVLREVVDSYRDMGRSFLYGCCIYPTAPFVTPHKLQTGYEYLLEFNFDTVFPVLRYGYPVQRALRIVDKRVSMISPDFLNSRSQDLEAVYHDSGQFYWFNTEKLFSNGHMFTNNSGAIIISELEAQDVDTEIDWKLAEMKFDLMNQTNKRNG